MGSVILKSKREESLLRRHPWIFSGAVDRVQGDMENGETVDILSADGEWLASGAWSPNSQIRVRVWSFNHEEEIGETFFRARIEQAMASRKSLLESNLWNAFRLIHAESDYLPGMIVDKYNDFLVCQFLSAGAEYWKEEIVRALQSLINPAGIYERSDVDVRTKEGLESKSGVLAGAPPPDLIEIREGDVRFLVDIKHGHKTGFYLDQRENHALITEYSKGAEVLNCFSYTGGFGIWALKAGAERVTNVESSSDLLTLGKRNVELNSLDSGKVENVEGDVFHVLRKFRDSRREFDLIILDPPKFVTSVRQIESGARGYKDINLLAMKLLRPGGILFTFSCSGLLEQGLFQKIVADAALDAGRNAQIIRFLFQSRDHPIALPFPEGLYLKGLICRVS